MPRNRLTVRRERLRDAIGHLVGGAQRRYPAGLRARIADYSCDCIHAGVPLTRVSTDLGVSHPTLVRILGELKSPGLHHVRVVPHRAAAPTPVAPLVVHGPAGIAIDGLDLDGVAALVRALA